MGNIQQSPNKARSREIIYDPSIPPHKAKTIVLSREETSKILLEWGPPPHVSQSYLLFRKPINRKPIDILQIYFLPRQS